MDFLLKKTAFSACEPLGDPADADVGSISQILAYERRARQIRSRIFDAKVINEASWMLLKDLFASYLEGSKPRTKELCSTTGLPQTTVIRYLDHLEKFGVVHREVDPADSRATLVYLSQPGVFWMHEYFEQVLRAEAKLASAGQGLFALASDEGNPPRSES